MRTRIFSACLLAGFAMIGAAVWSLSTEMRAEAGQIDLVSLRNEANSAMHLLQVSQQRRIDSLQIQEF